MTTSNSPSAFVPSDFDDLADSLLLLGSHFSPSELHGAFVGALSGAMRLGKQQWAAFALAVCGAETTEATIQQCIDAFGGLAEQELAQLAGADLAFRLFLPDDDYDIEQRTDCLASWCRGFLGGFAEARSRSTPNHAQDPAQGLPEAVLESLRDMSAIAQASVAGGEDDEVDEDDLFDDDPIQVPMQPTQAVEMSAEEREEVERDFTEVSEYLRLAALTVFTEYGWVESAKDASKDGSKGTDGKPDMNADTLH